MKLGIYFELLCRPNVLKESRSIPQECFIIQERAFSVALRLNLFLRRHYALTKGPVKSVYCAAQVEALRSKPNHSECLWLWHVY